MTLPSNLLHKIQDGQRINREEALTLFKDADLLTLGSLANTLNIEKNGDNIGYVIDRNLNYTNACVLRCKFCAFRTDMGTEKHYDLTFDEIDDKINELRQHGGTQILMQGGHHPKYKLDFYTDMISHIRSKHPDIHIHAFSPPELFHIAKLCKISLKELLSALKEAGLQSIPGGGAEILNDAIRKELSAGKCNSDQWIEVCETAHQLGIPGSATMMFGHVETYEDRVAHLEKIRDLQDRTGGFFAFIPWTFVPGESNLHLESVGGYDYLRTLAISRIFLDNFQNIQVSWLTQGLKMAQVATEFGGNDMGSTLLEENVVRSTGNNNVTTVEELKRIVADAGKKARQRNTLYQFLN